MRVHCLGGGLVGSFVTRKLVDAGFEVHLFDVVKRDTTAHFHQISALEADHSSADLIINMVPGSIGHLIIDALKDSNQRIIDLSFSEETPDRHTNPKSQILWDVGIAPGLSNMLIALAQRQFGHLDNVSIKVGGNPAEPDDEWSYMAPFSPHDVIAEYTRPARIVAEGSQTIVPAMSDLHTIHANGRVMEAFLTDGLRSLMAVPATSMGEYTVRWPGHIGRYQNSTLTPDELVDAWKFDSTRPEFTWMEVRVEAGETTQVWVIEDGGKDGDSSMARTTGLVTYCCAIAWLNEELFSEDGVYAPETLPTKTIEFIMETMKNEGVSIEHTIE
jgi:lysine 6-dehydrogenase